MARDLGARLRGRDESPTLGARLPSGTLGAVRGRDLSPTLGARLRGRDECVEGHPRETGNPGDGRLQLPSRPRRLV